MGTTQHHNLKIERYNGNLTLVSDIAQLIERNYSELFHSVIVHGSVATNEVIAYSDFDGLLIVKDRFVASKKLERFKIESMKLILKFDPLQHHGWFQIKESQLLDYPEYYLPTTILENSKALFPISKDIELKIEIKQKPDYKIGLNNMVNQLENKIATKWRPKSIFELKSLLSQIMLVPCLYYSAKNNEGIFKRESFDAVKGVFTPDEWMVMETASQIRNDWNPHFNSFQRKLLELPNRLIRKVVLKFMPINIPKKHLELVNDNFYNSLLLLLKKIKTDI
ncbi:nucleotidyltransferase domain-containing protein [Psychroserpens ponticola]|uniref:Nucleotidyltransferase domain-containing protein n=1 Tax=Psychroserpens ponticola TaxID=2932268 RepID=A0ABY7RVI9_9FLAO|nr:nucleotidyltransferase domain-containing protein [Psychroserpens ponticola]WCO01135.1 nucleotidyltransferase domain-containing protein [Psychroserpens ponticola]